jgi:uncharacterized ferredoxin-like protein
MLHTYAQFSVQSLKDIAGLMAIAARTAPKGRGVDLLEICIAEGDTIKALSNRMAALGAQHDSPAMLRDSRNLESCEVLFITGTRLQPLGLSYCGLCGFANCAASLEAGSRCAFNTGDLGIAIGSAASVAADHRVDNRIMYTVGMAVVDTGLLGPDIAIAYGIPLSATGKNPFFDRQ